MNSALAGLLKERIQQLGYEDIKDCARDLGLPYELLRKVISDDHIPKDKTLLFYAEKLGMAASELIQAAYRQKAPQTVQHLFNPRPVANTSGQRSAPVLGKAACGAWLESFPMEPDQFEPVELNDPEAFFVIAEGESMVGANIPPGAFLLVSPAAQVHNGNIVLAKLGEEEYTVKTLFRQAGGGSILQPMNPAFAPIVVPPKAPLSLMRITEIRIKL